MKKILFAFVALTFLFCACNKEGVYTPKKKISTVYYQKAGEEQKELLETYQWDGNKLTSRMFKCSVLSQYSDDFEVVPTYDGKRIVRVDETISGDYVEYIYEGKLLSKLSYHSGEYYSEATVEHKDGKISRIFIPGKSRSDNGNKFLSLFLSPDEITSIDKALQKTGKSLISRDVELLYTWEGDNVSEITLNGYYDNGAVVLCYEYKYKYDNMLNPLAVNWSDLGSQTEVYLYAAESKMLSMSKNNISQINSTQSILNPYTEGDTTLTQTSVSNISYEYEGKYPVKATHTNKDGNITETYYYEYLK